MTTTKAFPTASVLSVITGRLVSPIDGVYEVLTWMADEPIWTHQLPRVSREAQTAMCAQRPDLKIACNEAILVNRDNWQEWLRTWESRYGQTIDVHKLSAGEHESIDPISEAAERIHPDKIVAVIAGDKTE